jgi:hypothetical protein
MSYHETDSRAMIFDHFKRDRTMPSQTTRNLMKRQNVSLPRLQMHLWTLLFVLALGWLPANAQQHYARFE